MILITGASGTAGGAVLQELAKTGAPVRAMFRSMKDTGNGDDAETVIADFGDRASLGRALDGVDAVYVVCSPVRELVQLEINMIEACEQAGVRHVVLNSALGAGDYAKSFPAWHRVVEDRLKGSGLGYTILRPNSFMQNLLTYYAAGIRSQGAFYASMGNARCSLIDVRDVGAAAAKCLTSSGHAGKIYELNGPQAFTYGEVAEKISRAVGRPVQYVDIPVERQRQSMLDLQMPDWQVTALLDLQAYYTGGQGGEVDGVLAQITGRVPRTMDTFVTEYADQFAPRAAAS